MDGWMDKWMDGWMNSDTNSICRGLVMNGSLGSPLPTCFDFSTKYYPNDRYWDGLINGWGTCTHERLKNGY